MESGVLSLKREWAHLVNSACRVCTVFTLADEYYANVCVGCPVKMSKNRLREQSLAPGTDSVLVRATVDGKLVGHAFATFWDYEGHRICWITQLCVGRDFRRNGLATKVCLHTTYWPSPAFTEPCRSYSICAKTSTTTVSESSRLILLLSVLPCEPSDMGLRKWI